MSDLVKRLREDAEMWDAILGPGASITREAADAIEELTAALRDNIPALSTGADACRDTFCHRAGHYLDELAAKSAALLSKYKASNG